MKGSVFVTKLPKSADSRREKMIFDAVRRRDIAPIDWKAITTRHGGFRAQLMVSKDSLRVGDATDSIRATVNHETAQHIADELGVVLPTAKISDEIWKQATVRVPSMPHLSWVKDKTMGKTDRMVEQHFLIEKKVATEHNKGNTGLIADVGKDWVNTVKHWMPPPPATSTCPDVGPIRSANYGWHGGVRPAATPAGGKVWQPTGRCHRMHHTDYSQMVRLVKRPVKVWQEPVQPGSAWDTAGTGFLVFDIEDIAQDPQLARLVSHEGPLKEFRHPAVLRSCEPGVRCPHTLSLKPPNSLVTKSASSCPLDCEELGPTEPDPTGPGDKPWKPPVPPPVPPNGHQSPPDVAGAGAPIGTLLLVAAGLGGLYWWASRS